MLLDEIIYHIQDVNDIGRKRNIYKNVEWDEAKGNDYIILVVMNSI